MMERARACLIARRSFDGARAAVPGGGNAPIGANWLQCEMGDDRKKRAIMAANNREAKVIKRLDQTGEHRGYGNSRRDPQR